MANNNNQPVDMIDIARRTTQAEVQRHAPGTIKAIAPAKVNPVLAVGPKRADGYHDVHNVMQTIMLHDILYLWPLPETGAVICNCIAYEELPPVDAAAHDNLAVRAVRALAAEVFGSADAAPGVGIRLEKHVPAQAGLGGGSSDAAAALLGAAQLWQAAGAATAEQLTAEVLARVAATLGADVPFFLTGGAALFTGTGTERSATFASRKDPVVIIQPEAGLSTAAVYRAFDELVAQAGEGAADTQAAATTGEGAAGAQAAEAIYPDHDEWRNDLQAPAVSLAPEVGEVLAWAAAQPGVVTAQMSGSGSAVFVVCENFDAACKLAADAKLHDWWARTTMFGPVKAAVVPA